MLTDWMMDALDCQGPDEARAALVEHINQRVINSDIAAEREEKTAKRALEDAKEFRARAAGFRALLEKLRELEPKE